MDVIALEWLLLQNPRQPFSERRPRLPGQQHPGLGLLREFMGWLVAVCETHGLDGVFFVAAHYHIAVQSRRLVCPLRPADEARVREMTRALGGLSLPEAAAAVHAGRLLDAEGRAAHWDPIATVLPVSERLRALVSGPEYEAAVQREAEAASLRLAPARASREAHGSFQVETARPTAWRGNLPLPAASTASPGPASCTGEARASGCSAGRVELTDAVESVSMPEMDEQPIYLDYNATTPLLPEVVDAMLPYLRDRFGNPSSGHAFGRAAREGMERAREQLAALLSCEPEEIVFTSGGTEANNLAIRGVTEARPERRHIVTSAIEHPAVAAPCAWLERHGWRVARLGVDGRGQVRPADLASSLGDDTALVTVMHANNETGVVQPLAAIAAAARARGAVVHTDAAQSAGKIEVDVEKLGVDLLSVAGHKLYAPKGVGALYVRRGTPLAPFTLGAGHERGVRPGTENVASIVGLGAAAERVRQDLEAEGRRLATLRLELWNRLRAAVPGLALNGHETERLPNTLSVRFPGLAGNTLLARAPLVAASTGSACHDGHDAAPAVIVAMGVPAADAIGTVRLSLGRGTTARDIERGAAALAESWASLVNEARA